MKIPHRQVNPEALKRLIEDFVSRDGIDPGHAQVGIDRKVARVLDQLASGQAVLVYDSVSGGYNILSKEEYQRRGRQRGNDD